MPPPPNIMVLFRQPQADTLYTNTFLDWQVTSDEAFAALPDYSENIAKTHHVAPCPLVYIYKCAQRKPSCNH